MTCQSCRASIPMNARYCPRCANPIAPSTGVVLFQDGSELRELLRLTAQDAYAAAPSIDGLQRAEDAIRGQVEHLLLSAITASARTSLECGAVIVWNDPANHPRGITLTPTDGPLSGYGMYNKEYTQRRQIGREPVYVAIFKQLRAGEYRAEMSGNHRPATYIDVFPGAVTELDWR